MGTKSDTPDLAAALRYAAEQLLEVADSLQPTPELVSPQEAAGMLGVSDWTIRRWIHSGGLEAFKVSGQYRIPLAAVKAKLT